MTTILAAGPGATRSDRGWSAIPHTVWLAGSLAVCMLVLAWLSAPDIAGWRFADPDDLMRLQEVRDWLAGQSWFDVGQHRVDPPVGLPMHWSRLLDVPLAAVILLVRPFAGETIAEQCACAIVPLATAAVIALIVAALVRRLLASERLALLAIVFSMVNVGILAISRPMRIDHHAWQAACGLAMVLALIGPRTLRRSAIAGACAALWMHISLEGIVLTAGCGAWLGLRWILAPATDRQALPVFLAAITGSSLVLFLIAHGGALFDRTACDAVSSVHMTMFALAAAGSALAVWRAPTRLIVRGASLALVALACAAVYKLWAPQCAGGPFAHLTPLTYRLWYVGIPEGLPLWKLPVDHAMIWLAFPVVGLAGALVGLRRAEPGRRGAARDYAAMLAIATAIGIGVSRAGALSNLLAVPGVLVLLAAALRWATRIQTMPLRVIATAGLVLLAMPLTPGAIADSLLASRRPVSPADLRSDRNAAACMALDNLARLQALPPALFITTLAGAEAMLVATPHSVVGAGYHRNIPAMDDTIRFFVGDDGTAHDIARRHGVGYVAICPGEGDVLRLARFAPGGLAARLQTGAVPVWLRPVTVPGLRIMRVYAVTG